VGSRERWGGVELPRDQTRDGWGWIEAGCEAGELDVVGGDQLEPGAHNLIILGVKLDQDSAIPHN
jgi:hypothetical protein